MKVGLKVFATLKSWRKDSTVMREMSVCESFGSPLHWNRRLWLLVVACVAVVAVGSVRSSESPALADGITWTSVASPQLNQWNSVAYGNGLWVAVSQNGTNRVMTSPDAVTWTLRTAAEANTWSSVAYGNGLWVAVASSGTNRAMTSTDGESWTAMSVPSGSWSSVAYGNGLWVAVGTDGAVMTSPDGQAWTLRTAAASLIWTSVAYGNNLWVAVSGNALTSSGKQQAMTSPDGVTWTMRVTHASSEFSFTEVAFGNNLWVATTAGNDFGTVLTSSDGVTWTSRSTGTSARLGSVAYGGGQWVVVRGASGTFAVATSSNGTSWTTRTADLRSWASVAYGAGIWVAVTNSRIMTSGVIPSPALTPTFSSPVATSDGFTVNVTNYDANFTFSPSTSTGTVTAGAASGSTLLLTVTGLSAGASATVTVATSRAGYANGSGTVMGTALNAALSPTFSSPVATSDGFTVNVTNYDANFTFSPSTSTGTVTAGAASGSTLLLTVTGLSAGASATVTVATSRVGYANGSATVVGAAIAASSPNTVAPSNGSTPTTTAPANDATTSLGNRSVLAPPASPIPQLVKSDQFETLERPAGKAVGIVGGKETPAVITRTSGDAASVEPQRRSPSEVADLRRQGRKLIETLRDSAPASSSLGVRFVETKVGAVIRGAVVDPRDGKTPLDVPVEDVLVVGSGGVKMMVAGVDSRGGAARVQGSGALRIGRAGYVSLTAYGLTPGAPGEIIVMSTPRVLGTFTVAADGSFSGQVRLPDDIEGDHTVMLVAGSVAVSLGVEIAETITVPTPNYRGSLPGAGSQSAPISVFALLFLMMGVAAMGRRRDPVH